MFECFVMCRIAPNCVIKAKSVRTRVFVSDEIEDCKDLSGLYYLLAFQKVTITSHHMENTEAGIQGLCF